MKFLIILFVSLIAFPCYAGDYKDFDWGMSVKNAIKTVTYYDYKYKNIDKSTVRPWIDKQNRSHRTISKYISILNMRFTMRLHFFSDSLTYVELSRSYVAFSGNYNQEGEFDKIKDGLIKKYGKGKDGFWHSKNTYIEFNKELVSSATGDLNYKRHAWTNIRYYSKQYLHKLQEHNNLIKEKRATARNKQEKKKAMQIENDL